MTAPSPHSPISPPANIALGGAQTPRLSLAVTAADPRTQYHCQVTPLLQVALTGLAALGSHSGDPPKRDLKLRMKSMAMAMMGIHC